MSYFRIFQNGQCLILEYFRMGLVSFQNIFHANWAMSHFRIFQNGQCLILEYSSCKLGTFRTFCLLQFLYPLKLQQSSTVKNCERKFSKKYFRFCINPNMQSNHQRCILNLWAYIKDFHHIMPYFTKICSACVAKFCHVPGTQY